jgi:NAD(P)-dependent dehydrogenase (short-subunit alcohol dehydrogenase family)
MTKMEQVENMVKKTIAEFGKIDVLVNNVGYDAEAPLVVTGEERTGLLPGVKLNYKDMTEETWRTVVEANLGATFRGCKAVGPQMVKQKSGKIINVSSFCALLFGPADTHYGSAKYAINRLTKALALEWAPYNINVNCIGPGSFVTQIRWDSRPHMTREQVNQALEGVPNAIIPFRHHGDTRDLGLLAVYLASPASDYMTGQVVYLDGGITAVLAR